MTSIVFRLFFFSTLTAILLSPAAIWIARRFNFMDTPGSSAHKTHHHPVALVGGWVLVLVALIVGLPPLTQVGSRFPAVLLVSLGVFIFGLIDDRFDLHASIKLFGQVLAAIALIFLKFQVLLFPPHLNWLNILMTLLWLVGITNAFNLVDSMDGLAVGLAGISALFFMFFTNLSGQADLMVMSAVLIGACVGVYFFNIQPTRMFLGDSGSQWLGFVLAAIGLIYAPQGYDRSQSWFIPILLLGVPIFDTALVVLSRIRRSKPVYLATLDHTYHRMVKLGLSRSQAVYVMQITGFLLGSVAMILLEMPVLFANLFFALVILCALGLIFWLDHRWDWHEGNQ